MKEYSYTITPIDMNTSKIEFNNLYGGSFQDVPSQIVTTRDGGYIIAGVTQSNDIDLPGQNANITISKPWVFKLDKEGKKEWSKVLEITGFAFARGIIEAPGDGYVITGHDPGSNHLDQVCLAKLDGSGNVLWNKSYGGSDADGAFSLVNGIDGGYVIAGFTSSKDGDVTGLHGGHDVWILQTDGNGNLLWQKTYGSNGTELARKIIVTSDGNYLVCGQNNTGGGDVSVNTGYVDGWLIKIDKKGTIIWEKSVGGSLEEILHSVSNTRDAGFITTGYSYSSDGDITGSHGNADAFVVKLDKNGNKVWSKIYGGSNFDGASSILGIENDNYLIAGGSMSTDFDLTKNFGNKDGWVLKINSEGKLLKQKTFGGSEFDSFTQVINGAKGGYVFSGESSSNNGTVSGNHGESEGWVLTLKDF